MEAVKLGADWPHLIDYPITTHVGERMKLLNCVSQDIEALAKMLASASRAVSKYRANVPDHLSGHYKMADRSRAGGTRLLLLDPRFPSRPRRFGVSPYVGPKLAGLDASYACHHFLRRDFPTRDHSQE